MTRSGFTLLEVVVSLVVLEAAVLGVYGTLVLAARTTSDADRLERAVAEAEGVLDSLAGAPAPTSGSRELAYGSIRWEVESDGGATVEVISSGGTLLFDVATWFAR